MASALITSQSYWEKRKALEIILNNWSRFKDILQAVYFQVSGLQMLDAFGGPPLTLSEQTGVLYLPADWTGTVTMDNNQDLEDCDTDGLWFIAGNPVPNPIEALISQEYDSTLVKYSNSEPYNVYVIGIVKEGVVLTEEQKDEISDAFDLWVFHFGTWRDSGEIKENRTF